LWEAFEEDAHPPPSDVQTGQSIRFSKRRWQRLTHHNLRDFFATTCLEQDEPVPVPVLAQWLGHKDGGVLVLKRYVHPRQGFGKEAAAKVAFLPKGSSVP
jgi:integrase